jgi:hypothetical protein
MLVRDPTSKAKRLTQGSQPVEEVCAMTATAQIDVPTVMRRHSHEGGWRWYLAVIAAILAIAA